MAESHTDDGTDETPAESTVYKQLREDLKRAESLADTPFSALFHEARTAKTRVYSGVALPIRVRDGSLDVGEPVKTRQGEHFRPNDSWDATVSLPARSFMEVSTARQEIRRQLRDRQRRAAAREERENREDPR